MVVLVAMLMATMTIAQIVTNLQIRRMVMNKNEKQQNKRRIESSQHTHKIMLALPPDLNPNAATPLIAAEPRP